MEIAYSARFSKQYRKAPKKIRESFNERLRLFTENPFHFLLRNHHLAGNYKGYRSINITGDWRAVFSESVEKKKVIVTFEMVGTHSQLYK